MTTKAKKSTKGTKGKKAKKQAIEMYRVKVIDKNSPDHVLFGKVNRFSDEAKKLWKEKKILVEQAVYGIEYIVDLKDFIVEEIPWGDWHDMDEETRMPIGTEYDRYVFEEYKAHKERSNKAGKGIKKHKLFQVNVADGYAFYVVTKAGKKNVEIEWRGFGGDDYVDMTLGGGGSFPRHCIEPHIGWGDFWAER